MLLAQVPEPKTLTDLLVVLGFLLSLAVNVMTLIRSSSAQKREISFSEEYASKPEVTQIKSDLAQIREELRQDKETLLLKGEERAVNLHNRINPVVENTAHIKGQMEAFTVSFNNFTALMTTLQREKH